MQKHLYFLKYKFLKSLQFRSEIILWILLDFTPFMVLFFVLSSMYQTSTVIHGYSLDQITFYFLIVAFILGLTSTHFEGWRIEEIKMGKIDFFLTRPFSYLKEIAFQDIASKGFYLIVFLPLYIALSILVTQITAISFPSVSLFSLFSFLLLLIFAYLVELSIGLCIVLIGFWFEGSQGLEHFKWMSITLFSGSLIPYEFLPKWMQTISEILPLKYMYTVPLSIIQGRGSLEFQDLISMGLTLLFFFIGISLLWKKAILQYSSSGG